MAPKKQKAEENQKDIRSFYKNQNTNPAKVKEEKVKEPDDHLHELIVKFGSDQEKYTICCKQSRTVLQVIKSHQPQQFKEKIKKSEENIIIEVGEGLDSYIVATHFPCSCVPESECLTITTSNNVVEQKQEEASILPKENYSVFFIDREGGKFTKTKTHMIFRCNNILEQFRYFCVYGRKGKTVEEALRLDGRFVDGLTDFTLSNKNGHLTNCTEIVDNLGGKEFKIRLPKKGKTKAMDSKQRAVQEQDPTQQTSQEQQEQEENASASVNIQKKNETIIALVNAAQKGVGIKKAMEELEIKIDLKEIKEHLRQQFPDLKAWMESRFPGRSFEKTLKLKKENFGKIQQSFSEVHRLEKLLKMGKSVCNVIVPNVSQGTGFVLFDRFILTSAHLFKECVQEKKLLDHITVSALFNYDEPEPETNYFRFDAEKRLVDIDDELDYAVLELSPEGHTYVPNTKPENIKVPPGLLNRFGPLPGNGEACLIGHPAGSVKKIDPTCIIEPEKREQAVNDHLAKYKDSMFILQSVNEIKNQGIGDIMIGGDKEQKVATYNTFMYHGASGSPVVDAHGQIFGLHTGGYGLKDHVIEYAHPLLIIFERFVSNLKESGSDQMLEKVEEAATVNRYLKDILHNEPMEVD